MTSQAIDRQIEVDIPRCHQYNELMSSPEAHRKLVSFTCVCTSNFIALNLEYLLNFLGG